MVALLVTCLGFWSAQGQTTTLPRTLHLHQAWGTGVEHTDYPVHQGEFVWRSQPFTCHGATFYYEVALKIRLEPEVYVRMGTEEDLASGDYMARFAASSVVGTAIKVRGPECPEISGADGARSGIDFVLQ